LFIRQARLPDQTSNAEAAIKIMRLMALGMRPLEESAPHRGDRSE
jgi:hypothetical protein